MVFFPRLTYEVGESNLAEILAVEGLQGLGLVLSFFLWRLGFRKLSELSLVLDFGTVIFVTAGLLVLLGFVLHLPLLLDFGGGVHEALVRQEDIEG